MLDFDKSLTVGELRNRLADMPDDLKVAVGGEIVTGVCRDTDPENNPAELVHIETADAFDDWGM